MLSSTSLSPPIGSTPLTRSSTDAHPERRKRWTEAVYALCVFVTGVLLLMTAV